MKLQRMIISLILLFIGFVLIGEFQYIRIDEAAGCNFYTVYFSSVKKDPEFSKHINSLICSNNCRGFIDVYANKNTINNEKIYYCSYGSENSIKEKLGIHTSDFKTVISGKCSFRFEDLDAYSRSQWGNYSPVLYVRSDNDSNVMTLLHELENKYDVVTFDRPSGSNKYTLIINITWSVIISINALLLLYEIYLNRKNVAIKVLYGKRLSSIVVKNILIDIMIFAVLFSLIYGVLFFLSGVGNAVFEIVLKLALFIIANSLIHVTTVFLDLCKSLKNFVVSDDVNVINKAFMLVSSFLVLTMPLVGLNFYDHNNDYFLLNKSMSDFKQYYYIEARMEVVDEISDEEFYTARDEYISNAKKLYKHFYSNYDALYLTHESQHNTVYTNSNSFDYLCQFIPELKDKNKNAIITPKSYMCEDLNYVKAKLNNDGLNYSIINSMSLSEMPCFMSEEESNFYLAHDPIIIYEAEPPNEELTNFGFICKVNEDQLYSDLKTLGISEDKVAVTNVYENFLHYWRPIYLAEISYLIIFIIVFVFDLIIFISFINLHFKTSYKSFFIKYIFGNGMIERYDSIYVPIIIVSSLSCLFSYYINLFKYDNAFIIPLILCFLLKTTIVFSFLQIKIYRFENVSFHKLLKGGLV